MKVLKFFFVLQIRSIRKILKLTVKVNKLVTVSFLSSDMEFKMKLFLFLNQDFCFCKNKEYLCVRDTKTIVKYEVEI